MFNQYLFEFLGTMVLILLETAYVLQQALTEARLREQAGSSSQWDGDSQ